MATKRASTRATGPTTAPPPDEDVEPVEVPLGEDPGDTFHKPVLQAGPEGEPAPENTLVEVSEDVVRDFTYPGTQRPSQQLVATKGTVTSQRRAEEMGLESGQYTDYEPAEA